MKYVARHQAKEPVQITKRRWYQRWRRAFAGMAAAVVFVTTYALILPAITMERENPKLYAEKTYASLGEPLFTDVAAKPDENAGETVFFLSVQGENAGLSESYEFEDGVAYITDEEGREIELHRGFAEDGAVHYWFTLGPEETSHLTLEWLNGVGRMAEPHEIFAAACA